MDKKFRSIVEELTDAVPAANRDLLIQLRAQQVIASFGHLVNLINESYDAETADELTRRLINAARSGDEEKFCRKIRAIRESKGK